MTTHYLALSWSVSRGRETYGYSICRLDAGGKRYRCSGGGYDMVGTVFGQWLEATYQDRLLKIARRAYYVYDDGKSMETREGERAHYRYLGDGKFKVTPGVLYGMYHYAVKPPRVGLDGGCGIESMLTIARVIGLDVQTVTNRRGHTTGFIVTDTRA